MTPGVDCCPINQGRLGVFEDLYGNSCRVVLTHIRRILTYLLRNKLGFYSNRTGCMAKNFICNIPA
jgi:hypothetical protein